MISKSKYVAILAGVLASLASILPISAATPTPAESSWEVYTSFDCYPHRIMDSERFTYFFVSQSRVDASRETYRLPAGGLFYFDKQNPADGIRDLRSLRPLTGDEMRVADLNPRTNTLVIGYADGLVDVVDAQGQVHSFSQLNRHRLLKRKQPMAVGFPLNSPDIWIATSAGFMHIDGNTMTVKENPAFDKTFTDICPVGNQVVAIVDGEFYSAPADSHLVSFSSFSPMMMAAWSPQAIMPLSDNAFLYLGATAANNSSKARAIYLAKFSNGKWTSSLVQESASLSGQIEEATCLATTAEHQGVLTRDGYLLFNSASAIQFGFGLAANGSPIRKDKPLRESSAAVGSYDFENFWVYSERARFSRLHHDGSSWSNLTGPLAPEGPAPYRQTAFSYSPSHGLLVCNTGADVTITDTPEIGLQLSANFDGKWSNLSPNSVEPFCIASNQSLETAFSSLRNFYPFSSPRDIHVDADYPQFAILGSRTCGLAVVNLDDPSSTVLALGSPSGFSGSRFNKFPGFVNFFPANSWGEFAPVSVGGFDGDGTLWFLYSHQGGTGDHKYPVFYYWTPADRATALNPDVLKAADPAAAGLRFPKPLPLGEAGGIAQSYSFMLTPAHPSNRNKLVAYRHTGDDRVILVYDHNGTPDNVSDDHRAEFSAIRLPNGAGIDLQYIYSLAENPLNGMILIGCFHGVFEVDINSPIENGVIAARELGVHNADGTISPIAHESLISALAFDEYGRAWVGTQTNGVTGLASDYSRVVATYNTSGSPLPDDFVTGLGWDPARKRLMIGTRNGIASVMPDREEILNASRPDAMFAYPEAVTPDFAGNIAIHNVGRLSRLEVRDREGRTVAFLPAASDGTTFWDLNDTLGNPVESGSYLICDLSRMNPDIRVMIVR